MNLTKTKGWEILEAYIIHRVQENALGNMREFENNAVSETPDPHLVLRQTFQAGIIRGCGLVLNFPAFVENHFKFNHTDEDVEHVE